MKKLLKLVDPYQTLVFLDLEGTQFSHEMIALGAVKVRLHKNKTIKRFTKSMKVYVKPHEKIGRIVENLTKITGSSSIDQYGNRLLHRCVARSNCEIWLSRGV